jgi:hypothetical protein
MGMSTKRAAKSSTALTSKPGIGHNQPPADGFPTLVAGWDSKVCILLARDAFDMQDEASALHVSAELCVAAAIIGLFAAWHEQGYIDGEDEDVACPPLSAMSPTKATEDVLKMRTILFTHFFREEARTEWPNDDAKAQYQVRVVAVRALVNRALSSAAILFADGITLDDWNTEQKTFAVRPPLLIEKGWRGLGRLDTKNHETKLLLDNRSYMVMQDAGDSTKTKKIRASIRQLKDAYRSKSNAPKLKRDQKDKDASTDGSTAEAVTKALSEGAGTWLKNKDNLTIMAKALFQKFDEEQKNLRRAAYPEEFWNTMEKFITVYMAVTRRDNFNPPAGASKSGTIEKKAA